MDDPTDIPDDPLADLDRAEARLTVRLERRRYDKPVTVVEGFPETTDLAALAKTLKKAVGAGGTVADGTIELQGDHRERLPALLEREGYALA